MKNYTWFVITTTIFFSASLVQAASIAAESEHRCKIAGCEVKCVNKKGKWITVGTAKKVKITIYDSGVTMLTLDGGIDGLKTVVMGGEGYICSIDNQQD